MEHIFATTPGGASVKDFKFLLKKTRSITSKVIASLGNERLLRYSSDQDKIRQMRKELERIQELLRAASLFVECAWIYDPVEKGLIHVSDFPDILSPELNAALEQSLPGVKKEMRWDILKFFLEDKVLGPARNGTGIGVYSLSNRYLTLSEAYDQVKLRKS